MRIQRHKSRRKQQFNATRHSGALNSPIPSGLSQVILKIHPHQGLKMMIKCNYQMFEMYLIRNN